MNKLPPNPIIEGLILVVGLFILFTTSAYAVTVASQTQDFSTPFHVWQVIQELGTNLSGVADKFTFRVNTGESNLTQFDFTAENSRIYDKTINNVNSYIIGCVSGDSNNKLRGLTFNQQSVPAGYQDVTIDFSCRNYTFIPDHQYLILISNANLPNTVSGLIRFAASSFASTGNDYFTAGGVRYGNGNMWDFANNSGSCSPITYIGCNIWTNPKDDIYFTLTNTSPPPPPPKTPVIFIPGIGGSELKTSQDVIWSKDNGHGGIYQHAYATNEKVWVNQDEAVKLGDDDYFDVLKLKADGETSEASLNLTGNLTSFGYGDIDSFFTGLGYVKGTDFFAFAYDWRRDVRTNKDSLDSLIETAKAASGQSKVNIVAHSMGGLIARYYISDSTKASKVNKLIELGVPHLGTTLALKSIIYGQWISYKIPLIPLINFGLIPNTEIKDIFANLPSVFELHPSSKYFSFYNNSDYPFRDDRDIDNNKVTGTLNYDQTKNLLSNLKHNMAVFGLSEEFHNLIDPILNQANGTKLYNIVGTGQPTLGQIHETWWITWPINLIPKIEEIFINGDDTTPLYSASLKNDSQDFSGGAKIYYVEQKHSDLVNKDGITMQTVKSILDDTTLPVEVKDEKISLEGHQLSLDEGELDLYDNQDRHCGLNDKGEIEENIPDVFCTTSGKTKNAFVKKKASKVKISITRKKPTTNSKTTNLKTRTYKQDKISKTTIFKDIPINEKGKIEFDLDPTVDTSPSLILYPDSTKTDNTIINSTSEVTGSASLDQTPPTTKIEISGTKNSSGIYTGPVTITLTGNDSGSGILKIEYSLDNGQSVQIYTGPFTISTSGKTTLQVKSIDKLGNEEVPQTITIEINIASSSSSSSTGGSSSSSSNSSSSNASSSTVSENNNSTTISINSSVVPSTSILGIEFINPNHISDEINVSNILEKQNAPTVSNITQLSTTQILGGLLIVSGGIVTLASFGLITTFTPWKTYFPGGKLRLSNQFQNK